MKSNDKKTNRPLLSLSLNVYNEEENLERVYKEIKSVLDKAKISHEILFVEGGSKDKSWEVIKKLSKKYKDCKGIKSEIEPGRKVNQGMKAAKGKYFGYMCSDGQDNPNLIPQCINLLEKNKADFVKARRVSRVFWERKVISRIYNALCRIIFGLKLRDINMHPKIFKRELIKNVELISKGESVDLEVVLRAHKMGYRIMELPTHERKREGGGSSVNSAVALNMIKDMFSYKWGSKNNALISSLNK